MIVVTGDGTPLVAVYAVDRVVGAQHSRSTRDKASFVSFNSDVSRLEQQYEELKKENERLRAGADGGSERGFGTALKDAGHEEDSAEAGHSVCPDCGGGWTFDFGQKRVYCRTCEENK